uniref:Odorant receptor n=1 Tax=Cnaphalocrocis medinalis TaxID=437488 RepID=A0A1B2G2N7_CNAME|nr:olfactory receptor 40 [Cnaphalocrocis medinalis]
MLKKKIKAFFNKEGFDFTEDHIDPTKYHVTFFFMMRAYQVADEPYKTWTYIFKTFITICGIGVLTDACLSFYHAVDIFDMGMITEAGTYVLMLLYKMMTLTITKVNVSEYVHFVRTMKEDFEYISTKSNKYKKAYFETQLETFKASVVVCTFMFCLANSLVLFAIGCLLFYLATHAPEDRTQRPLVFPFWAPGVDYTTSPAFECAFYFANVGVCACTYNYTFVLQTNIVWVRQIASKAEMIVMCIKDLLEGIQPAKNEQEKKYYASLINFRMREIVTQHQSLYRLIDSYACVFKKCLMFEQMVSSPVICMLAYCSAEKLDQGEIHVVMNVLCVGAIVILFLPCYLCTFMREKLTLISDACWEIRFWDAGANIRTYLILVMQRCLRPLPLQAPGFEEVSIKTFSSKMTSAYSLFNMLRQADLDL